MAGISTAIQLDDRMSPVLSSITNAMNLMYSSFTAAQSAVGSGLDSAGLEETRQAIVNASAAAAEYQEQLDKMAQTPVPPPEPIQPPPMPEPPPPPPEPVWQSISAPEVFMNSGAERFAAEVQSANQMAQKLWQTQRDLTSQAAQTKIISPQMMNDLNLVNNKVWDLQARIEELSNIPVELTTEQTNQEIESIRQKLSQAAEAQSDLNNAISQMDVSAANTACQRLNSIVDSTEREVRDNTAAQEQFNESLRSGHTAADGLGGSIKRYAMMLISAATVGETISLADQVTQTTARLDLMNYGLDTTGQLQQKIFESAQRSRGVYQTTADAVAKLGMQARGAFSSNDELIAFSEQLNKSFVIAGTSAQGVESVMLQLTQAMAAGKLQGEELNAVLDNAQPIVQNIADYMGVPVGEIKKLASEGAITADIIKNAMFAASDETNAKFAQMPMTFGQVSNSIQNQALMAFQPALQQLSRLTQTGGFQAFVSGIISGIQMLASGAVQALDLMGQAALFAQENIWWLVPAIGGVAAAVIAYKGAVLAYTIVQGISNGLKTLSIIMSVAHGAAVTAEMTATTGLTAAQISFNAALLACPLTWIVVGIIAIVAALAIWINKVGGLKMAWLIVVNAVLTRAEQFRVGFLTLQMNVLNGIDNMIYGFLAFKAGALNALGNIRANGLMIIQDFVNGAIQMINDLIAAVNSIAGVSIPAITWVADFGSKAVETEAGKQLGRMEQLAATKAKNEADAKARQTYKDSVERHAAAAEMQRKAEIAALQSKSSKAESSALEKAVAGGTSAALAEPLGNIGGNTGSTAGDTAAIADQLDVMDEDLKYMRDAAEQEIINRFTLAELKVDVNNNNTLTKQTDFDDMGSYLAAFTSEFLQAAAEGEHI